MTSKTYKADGPLPVLVSARIRLDYDQRNALKQAYHTASNAEPITTSDASGTLQVVTQSSSDLERRLGMSRLVVMDLLNSRDTLSINIVLKLQDVLGVVVITPKMITDACRSYVDYIFSKED